MKTNRHAFAIVFFLLFFSFFSSAAAFRLPKIIGNNMVLQQQQVLPLWGWDDPGQLVTVKFAGQERSIKADASGYWAVSLSPLKASAAPAVMSIAGSQSVTLENILVGEVWLGSGQSNMEYPMKNGFGAKPVKGVDSLAIDMAASYPEIRLFKVEKVLSTPDVTSSGWNECKGEALANFSALSYYFARNLHRALHVPVGMIVSSWGGSRIEPWTPAEGYTPLRAFKEETSRSPLQISNVAPGKNYKSMVLPLAPFAIKGMLWYQGESNTMIEDGMKYADKMQALAESWRKAWNNTQFPVYSVAIAPYYYTRRKDALKHTEETEAEFWEAQYASANIPRTGVITITDLVDNFSDIHPPYKWEVGRRLSLLALANDYGMKKIESSGPQFKGLKITGKQAVVEFTHADGLKSNDGQPLSWFAVAGADGKFVPANAVIKGKAVVVTSDAVENPVSVRFGWNETAQPNLFNAAGLPARPFRTDGGHWEYVK